MHEFIQRTYAINYKPDETFTDIYRCRNMMRFFTLRCMSQIGLVAVFTAGIRIQLLKEPLKVYTNRHSIESQKYCELLSALLTYSCMFKINVFVFFRILFCSMTPYRRCTDIGFISFRFKMILYLIFPNICCFMQAYNLLWLPK